MRIRGSRRCQECGEEWSYYETGEATCPTCGSLRSVGIEEGRMLHTDAPVDLDLSGVHGSVDDRPLREVAADAERLAREYVAARGFVHAGELRDLDGRVLAAAELRQAAATLRRSLEPPTEEVERYFLSLLSGAPDGERPGSVPEAMWAARGLAVADVLDTYRGDVRRWLDDRGDPEVESALERLRERSKRIEALDGEVPPEEADRLVEAARDLGTYLREGEETALARALDRLERD